MMIRKESESRSIGRRWRPSLLIVLTVVLVTGCSVFPKSMDLLSKSKTAKTDQTSQTNVGTISDRADAAVATAVVSNPQAKEIRFDGQELVLGSGKCQSLPNNELRKTIAQLLEGEKFRSATAMANLHVRSAQRLLIDEAGEPESDVEDFVAKVLDQNKPKPVWSEHLKNCRSRSEIMKRFKDAKSGVLAHSKPDNSNVSDIGELVQAAEELESVPLQLEAQRISALAKVAAGESETAVNTLVSAAELAAQASLPNVSSDLWMMACQASMRFENVAQGRKCWQAAVATQLTAVRSRPADQKLPSVDTVFWEQADKLRHPKDQFPPELNLAFAPWYSRIGLTPTSEASPQVVLWATIAEFQLTTGQPHLAALSIKRAEIGATEVSKRWLRIALARSMAAQGQDSVAVTILGSLSDAPEASVRAASLATLGSIKITSGAYEQGSRFLVEALNMPESGKWPGQLAAKADLANVRLIVGRFDEALPALHAVQNEMLSSGRWQSLCQSLENEAAIVEIEQSKREARLIRKRIQEIEKG